MTTTTSNGSGRVHLAARLNLFEITNLAELATEYRLLEVRGLPAGDEYDKNVNQLLKAVAYETQQPVALVRRAGIHYLAVPVHGRLPALEQSLMPHVATLVLVEETYPLDFEHLDETTLPIAKRFLQYGLRTPLMRDRGLWGSGSLYYLKHPLSAREGDGVDVYPGFAWSVVDTADGRLFLALDTRVRYVDRLWLPERLNGSNPLTYRGRHCLYHFGHDWYVVQFLGLAQEPIDRQLFLPDGRTQPVDVLSYTREHCRGNEPPWVRALDPDSPTIVYTYPGRRDQKYGAMGLCKLTYTTAHPLTAGLHGRSILDPGQRIAQAQETVRRRFAGAWLGNQPIRIAAEPLEVERRVFPVPQQRFGHGRVLAIGAAATPSTTVTDRVSLAELGQRRQQLLSDPTAGPLDTSPFHAQYLVMPLSMAREVNDDFQKRFTDTMREISGRPDYAPRRVIYDDRNATTLPQQVEAIRRVVQENRADEGYALLVLPRNARDNLHNYIKRALWPDLQMQCAMAGKIESFYQRDVFGCLVPAPGCAGKLASYVRNCALGMMVVNRKWAWALETPLHYDGYIGIDVLNGVAGFTFVYHRGEHIFFQDYPTSQKERLMKRHLKQVLIERLREDLGRLGVRPRSIVVHRDGRSFSSELAGLRAAIAELKGDGTLPPDVVVGAVDIRKTSADPLRLVEEDPLDGVRNPTVGNYRVLCPRYGIVCTTGEPFRLRGTAKPLAAVIVEGNLEIVWVLEDIFALSQLAYTAPDKCVRLPATIKLAHAFLEPIAGEADDEEALYGDEDEEEDADDIDDQLSQ